MTLNTDRPRRIALRIICALTLGGILVAGLSPFHSPVNQVAWLRGGDGIYIGNRGVVLNLDSPEKAAHLKGPCAMELWLRPGRHYDGGVFLAFYTPENPRQFSLDQWEDGFILKKGTANRNPDGPNAESYVANALLEGKSSLLTITSDGHEATFFVDGVRVEPSRKFAFSGRELTGRLILGASPTSSGEWSGRLLGLAWYARGLTPARVSRHYQAWIHGQPQLLKEDAPVALYRFNEHQGTVIHNLAHDGMDLYIPAKLTVPAKPMLESPWSEFRPTWGYLEDFAINVAGFVPLGFFFCAYFSARCGKLATPATVLFGLATSLTIELLQAYLPTRNSGMTDLFTNTLGTCVGIGLFRGVARPFAHVARRADRRPPATSDFRFG